MGLMDQRDLWVIGCIESPLRVGWDFRGDDVVVYVAGEIDLSSTGELDKVLRAATNIIQPGTRLIVDLSKVEFLGVSGLHTLCRARERCELESATLMVVAANTEVTWPVQVLGLGELLGITAQLPRDCA